MPWATRETEAAARQLKPRFRHQRERPPCRRPFDLCSIWLVCRRSQRPFALPGFRFPPGAIALHSQLHRGHAALATTGWSGRWSRALPTVGNVYEPYLTFTPPQHCCALSRRATLVDAAYYALVAELAAIVIGDPLIARLP